MYRAWRCCRDPNRGILVLCTAGRGDTEQGAGIKENLEVDSNTEQATRGGLPVRGAFRLRLEELGRW